MYIQIKKKTNDWLKSLDNIKKIKIHLLHQARYFSVLTILLYISNNTYIYLPRYNCNIVVSDVKHHNLPTYIYLNLKDSSTVK